MTIAAVTALKLDPMKPLLAFALALFVFLSTSARAASDADVTYMKIKKVAIEEDVITITVAESKTLLTLIRDDYDPKYTGDNWHGMPVTRVQVISNQATFTVKRGPEAAPGKVLEQAWKDSLKAAKDIQDGKAAGGIGFHAPDIVIKGNMIDSITGFGYLRPTAK